ncbi:competence type IV pilus major pilin ComGC [Pygmaiobacter massiliensis]|uniref:competence type IV pilus major pilin ComGC n=1 Tax=Pygmaiobacter massiliensis TaxID=1917873 RepID=UPI000C7A348D|nr:type II secretion system protein [Pygmaiobacter massiliensis]
MLKKLYALKNKKGFTLVELMVVVAILGILVAVAVPVYNNATTKAETNTCAANIRTIQSALMQAQIDGQLADNDTVQKLVDNGYLQANAVCPSSKTAYKITINNKKFTVECQDTKNKTTHNAAVSAVTPTPTTKP